MIPIERRKFLLQLLNEYGILSIAELLNHLSVSHMTIRRDISYLEEQGKVIPVAGGVQIATRLHCELSHTDKKMQSEDEKMRIGQYSVGLIRDNMTLYLDAGTTTLALAQQLINRKNLTIFTNDFPIANYLLTQTECSIFHTGGKVDRDNESCVGILTANAIRNINFDIAFVSTSSWNIKGISTPSEDKVIVKQSIIYASKVNYLLTDSSKYGKVAPFHALDIEVFDKVITDLRFPSASIDDFKERGVNVVCV